MRTLLVVPGLTLLLCAGAHGQLVRGVVQTDVDAVPIGAALVRLIDDEGALRDSAVTDTLGRFILSARREGRYMLQAQHLAYTAVARPLEL
jgi:hypothetical protein